MQAANEALLKLLQVPKPVPQHPLPQQQHQQQAQARAVTVGSAHSSHVSSGAAQSLPLGALQVQQRQQAQQRPQQLLHQQHQLQLQQQAQAAQLWQLRQGLANAAAALPSGVSLLQSPAASLGVHSTNASLGPLAAQISAASTASANHVAAQSRPLGMNATASLAALPGGIVLSGVPVNALTASQVSTSTTPNVTSQESHHA